MGDESKIYFPLRSNARALITGTPLISVQWRIKIGALLHDTVVLEDGMWETSAGPGGSTAFWHPPAEELPKLQTPYERGHAKRQAFFVQAKSHEGSGQWQPIIDSPTDIYWRASFRPLLAHLPKHLPWLKLGNVALTSQGKKVAKDWANLDRQDSQICQQIPEHFVRNLVLKSANHDLVVASGVGAAVSMDSYHAKLIRARLRRGEARPVLGHKALPVLIPHVGDLDWVDIDEIRRMRSLRHLRALLREIEAAAWETATSLEDFEREIRQQYEAKLREANERLSGSLGGRAIMASVSLAAGFLASITLDPILGTLVSGASGLAIDEAGSRVRQPRWLAADTALRHATQRAEASNTS